MKKALKIFQKISTIIVAIVLVYVLAAFIYWLITDFGIEYGRSALVSNENLNNEGPFIFEKDSIYEINYIREDTEKGYDMLTRSQNIGDNFELKCYYYLDSTNFSFKLLEGLQNEKFEYEKPEKIVALSDIESNFGVFRDFLITNKVIDKNLNWIFGKGHLVLNGDFIDRSYFTTQVLWFIYKLEQEAERKGGKVHYILGNHEIMNIQGHNKYAKRKYKNIATVLGLKQYQLYDTTMHLGKWLQTKNVIEKIGDIVFVHGGISPELADKQIGFGEINKIARKNYQTACFLKLDMSDNERIIVSSKSGPYWYRGYWKDDLKQKVVDKITDYLNCSHIVVGHTIQEEVRSVFQGKIIGIDVEHPKDYYKYFPKLHMQGLLIENDKFYRIDDEGKRTEI